MRTREWFGGRTRLLDVARFTDERGCLWTLDFAAHEFTPVRSFVVNALPGAVRGEHGHIEGRQLLLRVAGEIVVDLVHEGERQSITLNKEWPALLISSPVWARQTYLGEAPCLVVYCDTAYNPSGYIRSHEAKATETLARDDAG